MVHFLQNIARRGGKRQGKGESPINTNSQAARTTDPTTSPHCFGKQDGMAGTTNEMRCKNYRIFFNDNVLKKFFSK